MDQTTPSDAGDPVVVTAVGLEASPDVRDHLAGKRNRAPGFQLSHDCSPAVFLRARKTLKFMSKQDRLAVAAGGKALTRAGAMEERPGLRRGVFMAVGFIPFRREEADRLCARAQQNGRFSMEKFSTEGYDGVNPILAFSCLPNMPAHHLSANFDIQGEYFITYPGVAQFYLALQEAVARLRE
ncbi:MAG: hypothetical protein GY859_27490, partial [Desulfobacterales bacterium]|nr:hypothetical protein [Desulfobacterales bacterium]